MSETVNAAVLYDCEIWFGLESMKLISSVASIEDALERARLAALIPTDKRGLEITIKLSPRPSTTARG